MPGGPNYNGLGIGVAYLTPTLFSSSNVNRNVIAHEFTHGYGRSIAGVSHPMGVDCYLPSGAAYAPGLLPGITCPWYDLLTPIDLMAQSTNIPNNWSGPGAVNEGTFHKDLWRWLNPEGDIALHTLPSLTPGTPTTLRATYTLSPSDSATLSAGNTYALKIPALHDPGRVRLHRRSLPVGQTYLVQDGFGLRVTSITATSATVEVLTH